MEAKLTLPQSNILWCSQKLSDLPKGNDWLSVRELEFLDNMKFTKRRADWRLGRWTAKQTLLPYLNKSHKITKPIEIEILTDEDSAPEVFINNQPAPVTISISHSRDVGFCAVDTRNSPVGCDVEFVEARTTEFIADYFTEKERAKFAQTPQAEQPLLGTLIWSAKESALKALRKGLSLDTRCVEVQLSFKQKPENWYPLTVRYVKTQQKFQGWWREDGEFVYSVVAEPKAGHPVYVLI